MPNAYDKKEMQAAAEISKKRSLENNMLNRRVKGYVRLRLISATLAIRISSLVRLIGQPMEILDYQF